MIDYLPAIFNRPIEFYSCFISYCHSDKVFAQRLHAQLQDRGIRCWRDEHQMRPDDDIYEEVQRGIKLWDKVLLCCSQASLCSWWVDNEIETAFSKERALMKERKKKILALIPIDLDGYMFGDAWLSGKKEQVTSRLAADFRNWERDNQIFERGLHQIADALKLSEEPHRRAPRSML